MADAACEAFNMTGPEPVIVTRFPETVAGPVSTVYVMAPFELELAETANGVAPYVLLSIGAKLSAVAPGLTVKLAVAVAAA